MEEPEKLSSPFQARAVRSLAPKRRLGFTDSEHDSDDSDQEPPKNLGRRLFKKADSPGPTRVKLDTNWVNPSETEEDAPPNTEKSRKALKRLKVRKVKGESKISKVSETRRSSAKHDTHAASGSDDTPPEDEKKPSRKRKKKQMKTLENNKSGSDSQAEQSRAQKRGRPSTPTLSVGKGGRTKHDVSRGKRKAGSSPLRLATPPPHLRPPTPSPPKKRHKKSSKGSPKASKKAAFSPRTRRLVQFATTSHLYLSSEEEEVSKARKTSKKQRGTDGIRALNSVNHTRNGWQKVGTANTVEIFKIFEHYRNDYTPHEYILADKVVSIQLLGHPCDRPKDIRARPFILTWINDIRATPSKLKQDPRPVYRVIMRCMGNCEDGDVDDQPSSDESQEAEDSDHLSSSSKKSGSESGHSPHENSSESDSDSSQKAASIAKKAKRKCSRDVILHVEVMSDDLNTAIIYQKGLHRQALKANLEISQHIRQCIMEFASMANMTAGSIKKRLNVMFKNLETPIFRRPTPEQVSHIVQQIRRVERMLGDPLRCIGMFAEQHPDKIFFFSPPDESSDPPTGFATGIKSDHCVQSLIRWGSLNGVGLDSSWRNKNENRAPVTFLTTVDENERMMPGPVYISSDIVTETLVQFLNQVKDLVEDMAERLLKGTAPVEEGHDKTEVLTQAAAIVAAGSWCPLFVMIDKSRAELNAIHIVWPHLCVRICQFHVVQAILRWEGESDFARPKLSNLLKYKMLIAFRELQRCRYRDEWDAATELFLDRLRDILANERVAGLYDMVADYFDANWFVEAWRDHWTDIGLPDGTLRDKISTNNFTERAFKTFDQIFLENRANKSAFRLVVIIANEWFSYYQHWRLKTKKIDRDAIKTAQRGHQLWSMGNAIIPAEDNARGCRVWHVANLPTK